MLGIQPVGSKTSGRGEGAKTSRRTAGVASALVKLIPKPVVVNSADSVVEGVARLSAVSSVTSHSPSICRSALTSNGCQEDW